MKEKINFFYQSIQDTQSTIRAIDVKLGFLFLIAFIPITNFLTIFDKKFILDLWNTNCLYKLFLISFFISWLASVLYLFFALAGMSDFGKKDDKMNKCSGIFYGEAKLSSKLLFLVTKIEFKQNMDEIYNMDLSDEQILKELIYEKTKVSYIREMKFAYYSKGIKLTFYWLFISMGLYILHILKYCFV